MFKKIWYIISFLLGISLFLKIFNTKDKSVTEEEFVLTPIKSVQKKTKRKSLRNLNSRQLKIVRLLEKRKVLLPSDIYSLHPQVSTRTLRRDMTSLVESNIVKQEGSTKDTRYILLEY